MDRRMQQFSRAIGRTNRKDKDPDAKQPGGIRNPTGSLAHRISPIMGALIVMCLLFSGCGIVLIWVFFATWRKDFSYPPEDAIPPNFFCEALENPRKAPYFVVASTMVGCMLVQAAMIFNFVTEILQHNNIFPYNHRAYFYEKAKHFREWLDEPMFEQTTEQSEEYKKGHRDGRNGVELESGLSRSDSVPPAYPGPASTSSYGGQPGNYGSTQQQTTRKAVPQPGSGGIAAAAQYEKQQKQQRKKAEQAVRKFTEAKGRPNTGNAFLGTGNVTDK